MKMSSNYNSLFFNAVKQVKINYQPIKTKSTLFSNNMDEEIEFEKETDRIGLSPRKKMTSIEKRNEHRFNSYKKDDSAITIRKQNNLKNQRMTQDKSIWNHDKYDQISDELLHNCKIIVVKNIPKYMTNKKIMDVFLKYGEITSLNVSKLIYLQNEIDSVEICYSKRENAVRAIEDTNGKEFFGKKLNVTFGIDNSKSINLTNINCDNENKALKQKQPSFLIMKRESIWNRLKYSNKY